MSLVLAVAGRLREEQVRFALIGAGALAHHGVSRATADLDLLAIDTRCLQTAPWQPLARMGAQVEVRHGDADDPLAGLVRLEFPASGETVDVVVGRGAWQARILAAAAEVPYQNATLPVASRAGLILLKLYAGGPQDAWDIGRLLVQATESDRAEVEAELPRLPAAGRRLWETLQQR